MTASANTSRLAFFEETTSGTPPADWVASGNLVFTMDLPDITSLQQSLIEDSRSRIRVNKVFDKIKGVRSTATFPYTFGAFGHGQGVIADGVKPTQTNHAKLMVNGLGGSRITESTFASVAGSHSTTTIELDDSTDYDAGDIIILIDQTALTVTYMRRILSKSGDIVTFDEAVPFTIVDNDIVQGHLHQYVDESVLCDSSVGDDTLSYAILMGGTTPQAWQTVGSKNNITEVTISTNEQVTIAVDVMVGSFTEPQLFSAPAFTTSETGEAAIIAGLATKLFIQDFGTSTSVCVDASEISITPGVVNARTEVVTECATGMEGIQGYHLEPADTIISVTRIPYDQTAHTELAAGTRKIVRYSNQLARGSGWGFMCPNCEINATPVKGEAGNRLAQVIEFRAHEDEDNAAAPDADRWKSKVHFVSW